MHQLNSSFTKKMFVCILTFYILCIFRESNMTFIYHSKTTGRFYLWHWICLRNNFNHHSWIILIKKLFFKILLRSGLYDVNVFAPNRFLNFYNGFTISFLKRTTSTQSNIQMSEKKIRHRYYNLKFKNVKKMTSNTILKSGLLGYSFGQIRMGVSSQKNTSSVIHFEKKIFVIFEKKQVIVSCKCRPAGSRLLLRLFIIYSAMYDVDILERLRQDKNRFLLGRSLWSFKKRQNTE